MLDRWLVEKLNLFSHVKLWIFLKAEKSWESHHTQLSQSHTSSHQTVEILLVESSRERASISIVYYSIYTSKWCWDVLSSWSCLWGIWTRAYTTSRASSALELQQSSNNCHSHSGFSRMSRQKAWRTCQRPQGFDSCMHKTLARIRSQQETENNSCCREPNWHLQTITKRKNQATF